MNKASRPLLLVGGLPGEDTESILRTVAPVVGDLVFGLTDGEPGVRRMWVGAVAVRVWADHPALQLVRKPRGAPGLGAGVPADYDDFWLYRTKPGTGRIEIDTLHYAADALAAYEIFTRLRDEGVIPQGVRFQFGFPFPEDACREFTDNARDMELMVSGYMEAAKRDIDAVCSAIPHEDLLLQWEVNWETLAVEHNDFLEGKPPLDYKPDGDPLERFQYYLEEFSSLVPSQAAIGIHFCYGDLHHRHFSNPTTLDSCVRLANAAKTSAGRRLDYVHMPVPLHSNDDEYFAPLADLSIGDTTLYIGLIHYTDRAEGALQRLATCRRYFRGPLGVATECGLGRRPPDQSLIRLLEIHREVAAAI
jgi:hypothetical protein